MLDLIDRNELHPTYLQGTYVGGGIYVGSGYTLDYDEVVNAPTVDAIPVEWLKKEAEDWEYHNELVAAVLKSIIKGRCWEKENE